MSEHFLSPQALADGGPRRLNTHVERMLWHLGFDDVRNIDGPGDGGADLLASLNGERFVFQCKWKAQGRVGRVAVDEVERAKATYEADRAVVVTNTAPDGAARARQEALRRVNLAIDCWTGADLERLYHELPDEVPARRRLRPYQESAVAALEADLAARGRALLILATGLGKTVVGGEVIANFLRRHPEAQVLVVAHIKELVAQLERALWRHLSRKVRTQLLTGDYRPADLPGVTCATIESALGAVLGGYRPALVMIDETHHVSESGSFQQMLDTLADSHQFGVTATPWRGDRYDITERFGAASFSMSIAEGMAAGYLAQVDYQLFVDDINWDVVRNASEHGYSLKELNAQLFLPQRDEAVIDYLRDAWARTSGPRALVFCQTIEHAERVAALIAAASPNWRRAKALHSKQSKRERDVLMADFRLGRVPIITTRDILNEGVDVPDVNLICFLRVTHSRRIFVQQLGRGLRLTPGTTAVKVLDFVTDIRRVAAALDIKRSLESLESEAHTETLRLSPRSTIGFSDMRVGSLMEAWIEDAASLESTAEEVQLQFPAVVGVD